MAVTRYTVKAERGAGPVWVLQCEEMPGAISETRTLADAERRMREAISFAADVPAGEVEVDLQVEVGVRSLLAEAAAHRAEAERLAGLASSVHRQVAQALNEEHVSMRDIGVILGVSHQRVHQLISS